MSLYIPTDYGLLGTHVTWEDVEAALQAALGTTSRFGADKKVTNIAEMKVRNWFSRRLSRSFQGFLSRIALVEPDWVRSNSEEEELPAMLVVKVGAAKQMRDSFPPACSDRFAVGSSRNSTSHRQ